MLFVVNRTGPHFKTGDVEKAEPRLCSTPTLKFHGQCFSDTNGNICHTEYFPTGSYQGFRRYWCEKPCPSEN
uniref:Knottins-like domain-containing protein n=1 Tax=Nymphaea colorata TaxID=210225 RepID=A0A5K1GGR0_9MAGN